MANWIAGDICSAESHYGTAEERNEECDGAIGW